MYKKSLFSISLFSALTFGFAPSAKADLASDLDDAMPVWTAKHQILREASEEPIFMFYKKHWSNVFKDKAATPAGVMIETIRSFVGHILTTPAYEEDNPKYIGYVEGLAPVVYDICQQALAQSIENTENALPTASDSDQPSPRKIERSLTQSPGKEAVSTASIPFSPIGNNSK